MKKVYLFIICTLGCLPIFAQTTPSTKPYGYWTVPCAGGQITMVSADKDNGVFSVLAEPATGYSFYRWADNPTDPTNPERTFSFSTGGTNPLRAIFVRDEDLKADGGHTEVALMATPQTYTLTAVSEGDCADFEIWSTNSKTSTTTYNESDGTCIPLFLYGDNALKITNPGGVGGTIAVQELECGFTLTAQPLSEYHFVNWTDNLSTNPVRNVDYVVGSYTASFDKSICKVGDTYYPTIQDGINNADNQTVTIFVNSSDNVTINGNVTIDAQGHQLGDVTITKGAKLILASAITINNLYLQATTYSSSQLDVNDQTMTYTKAYIDITMEVGQTTASDQKWYAFAVPFPVDVNSGVFHTDEPSKTLINYTDYIIWKYDGNLRASNMDNGWVIMEDGDMVPGQFYMIGMKDGDSFNTWRFAQKTKQLGGSYEITMPKYESTDWKHGGWNAMGNSTLLYVKASVDDPDITTAQVYDNLSNAGSYSPVDLSATSFVMASPFFIQVKDEQTLTLTPNASGVARTPQRGNKERLSYCLQMTNGHRTDRVFLSASEFASDTYEIGPDVAKIFGGASDFCIYANAYNMKLCAQEAPLIGDAVEYVLSLYAPNAGSYTLNLSQTDADATLWIGNMQIWDFSMGDYTIDLSKGTTHVILKISNARSISTRNKQIKLLDGSAKFIRDNQLYIYVNGKFYNAQGGFIQ